MRDWKPWHKKRGAQGKRQGGRPRKRNATLLQLATGDFTRTEREEEKQCDKIVRSMGGRIVRFSQARASHQTEGIPDRRYRIGSKAFWWEVKAADGQLTRDQWLFLLDEQACTGIAGCGTADDLLRALTDGDRGVPVSVRINGTVASWASRGFRGERKGQAPVAALANDAAMTLPVH